MRNAHNFTPGYPLPPMVATTEGDEGCDRCHHGQHLDKPCLLCEQEERRAAGRLDVRPAVYGC